MRIIERDRRECPTRCVGSGKRCRCMWVFRSSVEPLPTRDRSTSTAAWDIGPSRCAAVATPRFFLFWAWPWLNSISGLRFKKDTAGRKSGGRT
jgi:hypothetical protein